MPAALLAAAPASSSSASGSPSIGERFNALQSKRDGVKRTIYIRSVVRGFVLFLGGIAAMLLCLVVGQLSSPGELLYSICGYTNGAVSPFICVGLCLLSSVPSDEMNLDRELAAEGNARVRLLAQWLIGGLATIAGLLMSSMFPYVSAFPLLVSGLSLLFFNCCLLRGVAPSSSFAGKCAACIICFFLAMAGASITEATRPELYRYNLLFPGLWDDWEAMAKLNAGVIFPTYAAVAGVYCAALLVAAAAGCAVRSLLFDGAARADGGRPSWRTAWLLVCCHVWIVSIGLHSMTLTVADSFDPSIGSAAGLPLLPFEGPNLFQTAVFLLPTILLAACGPRRVFSFLARRFEHSLETRLGDGAELAAIAHGASMVDAGSNMHWVKREAQADEGGEGRHPVGTRWRSLLTKEPSEYGLGASSAAAAVRRSFRYSGQSWRLLAPTGTPPRAELGRSLSDVSAASSVTITMSAQQEEVASAAAGTNRVHPWRVNRPQWSHATWLESGGSGGGAAAAAFPPLSSPAAPSQLPSNPPLPVDGNPLPAWSLSPPSAPSGAERLLKITMREDLCPNWDIQHAKSSKSHVWSSSIDYTNHPRDFSADFVAWRDAFFKKSDIVAQSEAGSKDPFVVLRVKPDPLLSLDKDALQKWVVGSFKCFEWRAFVPALFTESPRGGDGKLPSGGGGESFDPTSVSKRAARATYFVSHTWSDSAEQKVAALRGFFDGAPLCLGGASPTIWLDNACFARDAAEGQDDRSALNVVTLPITLALCDKVIVLLGPNYLTRLWCVWELFSIFAFCNPHLAMERVILLPLGSDFDAITLSIENFDVWEAHCFDPNEELKLRRIVAEIGAEKFQDLKLRLQFLWARTQRWCCGLARGPQPIPPAGAAESPQITETIIGVQIAPARSTITSIVVPSEDSEARAAAQPLLPKGST